MDQPKPRVGAYLRISQDQHGTQTATARQREDIAKFAELRGWQIADEFEDVDLSAFKRVVRPEFDRMLAAITNGEIEGVVVWKLDRLSRQQRDFSRVMDVCEASGGFVASVTEPIDTRDAQGQLIAELLVSQARLESANLSTRLKRKAEEVRREGKPPTNGKRCFGYTKDYSEIVGAEAAILREVRDRVFAGESMWGIAEDLQRRDVRTTWGNCFRSHILKKTLLAPTICAEREHEGKRYPGTWQPIFTPEEQARLRVLLDRRPHQPRVTPVRRYLLTGFVRCETCGARLKGHALANGKGRYLCARVPGADHCGSLSVRAEPLEEVVKEMLLAVVNDGRLREAAKAKDRPDDGLLEMLRKDELRLEQLSKDHYVEEVIGREEFLAARGELVRRIETNRTKLARRAKTTVVDKFAGEADLLRTAWDENGLEWRRTIIGALLDHVAILPGKPGRLPFDPERVRPVWRV